MSSSKRHFTAVVGSKEHGLYISSSPSSAARKIVSKLCASSKSKKVEFCVREITQGSKKKTYGPYLGEMKKLAKPIELKGRIIRYAPEVHLKKKKTATKTANKIGKKMRGGGVRTTGIPSVDDFIIPNYSNLGNKGYMIKYNRFSNEPYIFYGKTHYDPRNNPVLYYFKYVAYNSGYFGFKKPKFKKINVDYRNDLKNYTFEISEQDTSRLNNRQSLKQFLSDSKCLIEYIDTERKNLDDSEFCSTIYEYVKTKNNMKQKIENEHRPHRM